MYYIILQYYILLKVLNECNENLNELNTLFQDYPLRTGVSSFKFLSTCSTHAYIL